MTAQPFHTRVEIESFQRFTKRTVVILCAIMLSSLWWLTKILENKIPGCTMEGAKESIVLMKDWTVWMAGIQTATIAALGILVKDDAVRMRLTQFQLRLLMLVALFNTCALFFSAWLLTSLSSLMLRVYQPCHIDYDFYNFPIYAFMEGNSLFRPFTVGFFAFWNHWLWGLGILLFGLLALSVIVRPPLVSGKGKVTTVGR